MAAKQTFEEALALLEGCTEKLSSPDITLEESIDLYAQSVKLIAHCQKCLERAKLKIETLSQEEAPAPGKGAAKEEEA